MTSNISPAPSPQRAVYGFAVYVLFVTLFIAYCLWVYLPTKFLEDYLGLHYLPDKYFALSIPVVMLCGTWIFAFLIYPFIGFAMTPAIDHMSTVKDSKTIYRCGFLVLGEACGNIVEEPADSIWENQGFCNRHLGNLGLEAETEGRCLKTKCMHCLEFHKEGDDKQWNGSTMPAARDLDLREISADLVGNL